MVVEAAPLLLVPTTGLEQGEAQPYLEQCASGEGKVTFLHNLIIQTLVFYYSFIGLFSRFISCSLLKL